MQTDRLQRRHRFVRHVDMAANAAESDAAPLQCALQHTGHRAACLARADDNDAIELFEWRKRRIEIIERYRQAVFGLDGVHSRLPYPSSIAPPQFRRRPCERQFIRHWLLHPRATMPLSADAV